MSKLVTASDELYPELIELSIRLKREARWNIFPRGYYILKDGLLAVFDYKYRPICSVQAGRKIAIVPAQNWILHVGQHFFYPGTVHPDSDFRARRRVLGVVERLGLSDELIRRRQQELDGTLPPSSIDTRTPA